jgi:inhibitor of KinA
MIASGEGELRSPEPIAGGGGPSQGPVHIDDAGDRALVVRFAPRDAEPAPEVAARVAAARAALERAPPSWVIDLVPAYASLLVWYDPLRATAAEARALVEARLAEPASAPAEGRGAGRLVEIPVWYDPAVAPDLADLAAAKGLDPAALAARHAAPEYLVYAIGFRPGFPFLGTVEADLAAPRLDQPRPRVAAGSVGIAGRQTGIYPVDGPGGWRIVGRTPLAVFDRARPRPFLLEVGDRVRFVPIDRARFEELGGR